MDQDFARNYRRWQEADEADRNDDADAACRSVFAGISREAIPSPDFVARTLTAVAAAAENERQRARRLRRGTVAVSIAATVAAVYFGGGWALSMFSSMLVSLINVLVGVTVRGAAGLQAGTDLWSMLASLGRTAAAFVANPAVTGVLLAMQGLAMAALIALRRLLESDRESFK
jgi:hypothetical protein